MAYQQSPGIEIVEKDASAVTIGLSSTTGAYVGAFRWGPVDNPMLIGNEVELATVFGKPDQATFPHFFAVANFLNYTNACWVNRIGTADMMNAVGYGVNETTAEVTPATPGLAIANYNSYESAFANGEASAGRWAGRYSGTLGNGLIVSIADSATFDYWPYKTQFTGAPGTSKYIGEKGRTNDELHIVVVDGQGKFTGTPGEVLEKFPFVSKAPDAVSWEGLNNYYISVISNRSQYIYWLDHPASMTGWGTIITSPGAYTSLLDSKETASGTAAWVAAAGSAPAKATITYATTTSPKYAVGSTIIVKGFTPTVYNGEFIVTACTATTVEYSLAGSSIGAGSNGTIHSSALTYDYSYVLVGGVDSSTISEGAYQLGWDVFKDSQTYDISLLITGNASISLASYVVQSIAEVRRDCVAFVSITESTATPAEPIYGTNESRLISAKNFKGFDSTYAVVDSGYKYMYDKYNDKYRWVALNADVAGLCARVDATNDPWYSPAGMTKGQIKGAIKLSWNPNKAERDKLYPAAINPVISQVGQGTILFGDHTATTKPSAFDKINVRRMFLVLEKAIANSAKYQLFELNDEITRLQFVSSIEPFLRDVKGRRGIDDYRVICDETNNTPQVIATNNFVGTIMVRPKYSINFITLNFVAVGPNVTFEVAATV